MRSTRIATGWNDKRLEHTGRWCEWRKYAPLDPRDLLTATATTQRGWRSTHELARFYPRARSAAACGDDQRSAAIAAGGGVRPASTPGLEDLPASVCAAQFWTRSCGPVHAQDVRLYSHLTACALEAARFARGAMAHAGRRDAAHSRAGVRGAAGAIENARLLLTAASRCGVVQSVQRGWAGLHGTSARHGAAADPSVPAVSIGRASTNASPPAVAPSYAVASLRRRRTRRPANMSVTLLPRRRASDSWVRGAGATARRDDGRLWLVGNRGPAGAFDAFRLLINLEQRPHADNRIVLAMRATPSACARALHWRWRDASRTRVRARRSPPSRRSSWLPRDLERDGRTRIITPARRGWLRPRRRASWTATAGFWRRQPVRGRSVGVSDRGLRGTLTIVR